MSQENQPFDTIQEVKDIKRLMERSSRFTSLSGLSCVSAGIAGLLGAWAGYRIFSSYYGNDLSRWEYSPARFASLRNELLLLAAGIFLLAFFFGAFFTWRKARNQGVSLWGHSSRRVFWNMAIPLGAGGLFVLGMLRQDEWRFVSPACLVFYGLALVNAGKYTLADIRNLGYCEIVLGLVNMLFANELFGYGIFFWAVGFGFLHIVYGTIMWWKYERVAEK